MNTVFIIYALLAAVFYAINTPFSALLLEYVPATFMASFLYLGAGCGVGIMFALHYKKETKEEHLCLKDMPYTAGMVFLDILAPIFLMLGIKYGSASNASLLGNFEIVATTIIALVIFHEKVTKRLWIAIALVTLASISLSLEGTDGFRMSYGSLFVLLATLCWGLENNCTRQISSKSSYEIVTVKGLCSGAGSFIIALVTGEKLPDVKWIALSMVLGFVAYGLSIFMYIKAQSRLGAAKTSAYYSVAPFIGSFLSFVILKEHLGLSYFVGLFLMLLGTVLVVIDTIIRHHEHIHTHTFTFIRNGVPVTATVTHSHEHDHMGNHNGHGHHHSREELLKELGEEEKQD